MKTLGYWIFTQVTIVTSESATSTWWIFLEYRSSTSYWWQCVRFMDTCQDMLEGESLINSDTVAQELRMSSLLSTATLSGNTI